MCSLGTIQYAYTFCYISLIIFYTSIFKRILIIIQNFIFFFTASEHTHTHTHILMTSYQRH